MSYSTVIQLMLFQSTLSVRRATVAILTVSLIYLIFQSTLSVRRATFRQIRLKHLCFHFNPRSPWGERPAVCCWVRCLLLHFNPRSPWGERLIWFFLKAGQKSISIHALREESDRCLIKFWRYKLYFNPRSPWGERLIVTIIVTVVNIHFNPRSPWGERH